MQGARSSSGRSSLTFINCSLCSVESSGGRGVVVSLVGGGEGWLQWLKKDLRVGMRWVVWMVGCGMYWRLRVPLVKIIF